ncbi:MAG: glycoside hydrolase family 9 protein [Draconibacterium sp.]|nr:glycoside hydrolase family 9 protein [Draconibacterium sp.]
MLGDATSMTDDLKYNPALVENEKTGTESGKLDDRLVFTESHAGHEYKAIEGLAAAARVLEGYNNELATRCLNTAMVLYDQKRDGAYSAKINATVELLLSTRLKKYGNELISMQEQIISNIGSTGWSVSRVLKTLNDTEFNDELLKAYKKLHVKLDKEQNENPFGVPYNIRIWGDGWGIQRLGMQQYFLHKNIPELFEKDLLLNALNFILGNHPGENTSSFASGVGSRSITQGYGVNRADRSFIPGGVASGTGIIRPDFPELKEWPYFWQQTEYVMGGGATNFMFLVLAADNLLK